MTIDTDIFNRGGVDEDQDERAQRAVKAFRAMQPTLSAYARTLSKNKNVRVEMAARDNGSTDGKRIYFRPPIALGDKTPHNRSLCDQRDEYKQLLCDACAIREGVLVTIYHEIAHICYDSFAKATDADRRKAIEGAIAEAGGKWADRITERIEALPSYRKESYMGLAHCVNEHLPFLVNALEDARVNRELFAARKGVRKMFDANVWKIFTDGVEQKDENGNIIVLPWNEYPLNAQITVGCFCKASGYDYSNWFHPRVVEALDDTELTKLIRNNMDTIRSAGAVYNLAFRVLARLRELGFLGTPQDPDPEPEPEENEDESSDESQDADQPQEGGDSSDSDSVPGQPEQESSSGDEPDSSEGQGTSDSEEADEHSDRDDSQDLHGDSQREGGDSEREESPAPDGGDDSQDDTDSSEGESDSDSVPGDDAAVDGQPEDGSDSAGTESSTEAPGESSSEPGDDEPVEGLRGQGDIDDSSSGNDPQEASEESDADSEPAGGGDSGERSTEEVDRSDEPGPAESGTDVPAPGEEEGEPLDSGADDGYGGTALIEKEEDVVPEPPMGSPEDVETALLKWGDHDEKPKSIEAGSATEAVDRAIIQGIYFTTPSRNIFGVREHRYGHPVVVNGYDMSNGWTHSAYLQMGYKRRELGIDGDFTPPESILGEALQRMRVAFSDNQRGKDMRHRKTGKVDARVLGKRAHLGDERLFKKRILPGKKDYFVLIGMDISGSTIGKNIALEKRAVMAQATLCSRLGIKFAIYGHSGNYHDPTASSRKFDLDIYMIKEPHEVWDTKTKERLINMGPDSANLDGHTLEYYRKVLDERNETDRIILYYTDGKMPAENEVEELEILRREIRNCKNKNYTLLGVGIRTDSPIRHGLDTVQVNDDADVVKVVRHLEKRLLGN